MDPAVILDLDGILFDNSMRMVQSINSVFLKVYKFRDIVIPLTTQEEVVKQYSIDNIFEKRIKFFKEVWKEIEDKTALNRFKNLVFNNFLSNTYITLDTIYEGSIKFTNILSENDYKIVYFTGRHDAWDDSMRKGTEYMLKTFGFPFNNKWLIMKPNRNMNDEKYKEDYIEIINKKLNEKGYQIKLLFDDLPNVCKFYIEWSKIRGKQVDVFTITNTHKAEHFKDILPKDKVLSSFKDFFCA